MEIGFSTMTINPDLPCHLEGYNDRVAIGQHDDIYVNTIYINGETPVLFHILDIILIQKEFAEKCRKDLSKEFDIPFDNIFISGIHTHSAPKVSTIIEPDVLPDVEYMEKLRLAMIKNAERCINNTKECDAYLGTCEVNNFYGNRNNKNLKSNNNAYLIQFRDKMNKPILALVNMACHATILHEDNLYVSSDYVGELRKEYEKITDVPLFFMNGECGDVSTRFYRKNTGFEEVERVGKGIACILSKIDNFRNISLNNLTIQKYELTIDYNPKEDEFLKENIPRLENIIKSKDSDKNEVQYTKMMLNNLMQKYIQNHIHLTPTTYVVESDDFRIITIPGEIVYNLGHILRSYDNKPNFICAYTNDFNFYAVDESQYGKYFESYNTFYPKGKADEMVNGTIKLFNK